MSRQEVGTCSGSAIPDGAVGCCTRCKCGGGWKDASLGGRADTTCYIGEEFIGEIHRHAIGASVYNLAHQYVIRHAPSAHYKTLSMQVLDKPWGHQGRVWIELHAPQCMRLRDHDIADRPHQPARGTLGSISPHRLQMYVLERGEGGILHHTVGAHQVYRLLG